ncbi:putative ABC transport system substrate-binding protein [Desulfuromusa kysingii]|uniref:Putative ABC transport system substrate-binding protein n=2 Tax=Desulfuromusa kysingii TaxID=37625 RepID=A0A1H3YKI9_9BACT|nr:putative ABC transport system substrate-binding protein [Desulfuromusa kysingii]
MLIFFISPAWAEENVTILYPDVSAPYDAIFDKIIAGIDSQQTLQIHPLSLKKEDSESRLKDHLIKTNSKAIIALGKRGTIAAETLQNQLPTIYGALLYIPEGKTGISLSADPQQQFDKLKAIAPKITTISVVFSPSVNTWLISLAELAAEQYGLTLKPYPVENLREAVIQYRDILQTSNNQTDAIWLPLDPISANEKVVLPMLLQESWNRDLVIFSSKPTDVQRGVLFSMYADNFGMGQDLAHLLVKQLTGEMVPPVSPVTTLLTAVNLRTAAHLGFNFTSQQQRRFDLTFPSR